MLQAPIVPWGGSSAARAMPLRGRVTVVRTPSLPQNSVWASYQDRRGYLWVGTEEGIARFDGAEWKAYRIADGLASSFVQTIAEDGDGCIWIGTRVGGLSRHDPIRLGSNAWRSFTTADGLADNDVRAIRADREGSLWLATRSGLVRLSPSTTSFHPIDAPPDLTALLIDSRGRIWAGSRRGLVGYVEGRFHAWTGVALPPVPVTALAEDRLGTIWIGTEHGGVLLIAPDGRSVRRLTTAEGLRDDRILSLLSDANGDVWIGTERGGVVCARGGSAHDAPQLASPSDQGLAGYMNLTILQDRSGLYWFGSLAGLTCYEPEGSYISKTWTSVSEADGLARNPTTAIEEDSTHTFWFGTYGGGASAMRKSGSGRSWETFDSATSGLAHDIVRAVREDGAGRIWFGTLGGGLTRFDRVTRSWRTFTTADGLAGNRIRVIRSDDRGRFWIGTDGGGISIFDPLEETPEFANITDADGLPSLRISSILHDTQGRVWIGTYEKGVVVREADGWSVIDKESGLPANDVYCIAEDPARRIWLGTGGSGMACLDRGTWRTFSVKDGLPNDTIYQILVESERSIYASTNRGVFRLRLEPEGELIVSFDRTDGLADDECNGGASCVDSAGQFWFGTLGGVSYIDPRDVPERIAPCVVHIDGFFVHDRPLDLDRVAEIEDSELEFSFDYGAVEYVSPQKVRYRTRLEGFDRGWSKVTAERRIRYTNLRPGSYRFQVQARNWGGEWGEPAEIGFRVIPDRERVAAEERIERERIEKRVLETAHAKLQQLTGELQLANEKLRQKEMQLELQAREDSLTGLLNRRYLDIHLQQEFDRAVRFQRPLTIVMADIDHFKSVNDRFSHSVGDAVLRTVARLMRTTVRSIDIVGRYGGEEFALLLPETSRDAALMVCEKMRASIAGYPWHEVHPDLEVTASFGCSDDTSTSSPAQMLHAADQNLFEAKRRGRNRVWPPNAT